MKRKFTLLVFCGMLAVGALAQKPSVVLKKASVDPVVDGVIDDVWSEANAENNIELAGSDVPPTLGEPGETTWQGLWTYDGIYILLRVTDDAFYPHYAPTPPGNSWEYDKPELYFDVNFELIDAGGPSTGNGHYQVAPAFTDGSNDGTLLTCGFNGGDGTTVEYAMMVDEPNYIVEYFVPFSGLLDKDGIGVELTSEIGFDATIIDRDPGDAGNRSAVWSNIGTTDGSWVNMDDCGIITLEGADDGVYIDEINLTGGEITENNGMLQIEATFVPEDATNKNLSWSVVNGTGKAKIDSDGVLTAVMDGDVTVVAAAQDGSYVEASVTVSISNQIVSMGEINEISNPNFDLVNGDGTATFWGGWGGDAASPMPTVQDGIVVCTPTDAAQVWQYSFSQTGLDALPDIEYVFSFVASADDVRTFQVDFEDTPANNYNRYGASNDPIATEGRSEWTFDLTVDPTRYTFDVTFDQMVETTVQFVTFQMGTSGVQVYLDSIVLVAVEDFEKITDYTPVETILVSGADDATSVEVEATLQMSAEVFPVEADYQDVKWSVVDGTGSATIDADGLLSGASAGTITVLASAVDDSYEVGELQITVGSGVGISQNALKPLKVYPNPASDQLVVELPVASSTVSIYNSVGMLVDQVRVSGSKHVFDISSYASGLYFVRTDQAIARFVK